MKVKNSDTTQWERLISVLQRQSFSGEFLNGWGLQSSGGDFTRMSDGCYGSKLLPQWDLSRGCQLKRLFEPLHVGWASSQYDGLRVAVVFYLDAPCFNREQGRNCSAFRVPASVVTQQHFLCILLVTSKSEI